MNTNDIVMSTDWSPTDSYEYVAWMHREYMGRS